MSMYYSPSIVRILMEDRLREAREAIATQVCCNDEALVERETKPKRSFRSLFRRESPAPCAC